MHGVVPQSMWKKVNPPDANNMCSWAMRCLLVEIDNRLILIDNGMGNKQSEKFFGYYYLHGDQSLEGSLHAAGVDFGDITDVFLTHLHFDHCGGSINRTSDGSLVPAFPNAQYWSNKDHWQWASEPNAREKASFLKENFEPIQASGQLNFVDFDGTWAQDIFPGFSALRVDGHTDAMMIPHIEYQGKTLVYMADLLPSVGHIPLAWVMGYDTRPLITLQEKGDFLNAAADKEYVLLFEHDPVNECCTLKQTEKGVRLDEAFSIVEGFGK